MLIEIPDDIVQLMDDPASGDLVISALDNISIGRRDGNHLIYSSYSSLESLSVSEKLSRVSRGIYSRVFHALPQKQALLHLFKYRVRLRPPRTGLMTTRAAGCTILDVAVDFFQKSTLSQKAILLCENQIDTRFYILIAKLWLHQQRLNSLTVAADHRGGGGSTVSTEFLAIQNAKERLCICVVDSDKKAPSGAIGSTANAVMKADDPDQPLTFVHVLNSKEAENLVPFSCYSDISAGDPNRMKSVTFLESIDKTGVEVIIPYLDMKTGIPLKTVKSSVTAWKFWDPHIRHLILVGATTGIKHNCLDNPCERCKICESGLFDGFNDVLDLLVESIEKIGFRKFSKKIHPTMVNEVTAVGEIVASWCCGSEHVVVY